ncbi:MAG: hypothetical protein LBE67_12805 [Kocuria palustris]|nr:hypothetical protein [Kocuria palustris]
MVLKKEEYYEGTGLGEILPRKRSPKPYLLMAICKERTNVKGSWIEGYDERGMTTKGCNEDVPKLPRMDSKKRSPEYLAKYRHKDAVAPSLKDDA